MYHIAVDHNLLPEPMSLVAGRSDYIEADVATDVIAAALNLGHLVGRLRAENPTSAAIATMMETLAERIQSVGHVDRPRVSDAFFAEYDRARAAAASVTA